MMLMGNQNPMMKDDGKYKCACPATVKKDIKVGDLYLKQAMIMLCRCPIVFAVRDIFDVTYKSYLT